MAHPVIPPAFMSFIFQKKSRWAWILCLLLSAGFLAHSISDYLVTRANVRQTMTESTLPLSSDNVYSEIQRDLLSPILIASMMANNSFLRGWVTTGEEDEERIVGHLREIKSRYRTVTSFFVSEKTRNYYHADGLLKKVREDEARDAWYFRVRDMKVPYEINVDPDMANRDETTIFINYRVHDEQGRFIGATGVGLTVNRANQLISRYETKYARQIYFVNATGDIVLRPSNSPMRQYRSLGEIDGLEEHAAGLLDGSTHSLTYERGGERRIMNCRFVPELNWYLIVEQSEESMLSPLRTQLRTNIITGLLMTMLVGFICIWVIRSHKAGIEAQNLELTENSRLILQQKADLDQKAAELEAANAQLLAVNHEKDEFLSIAAHDLRNPLSAIISVSSLIEQEIHPEGRARELLALIHESGQSMLELIEELLNVARIESFHGEIEKRAIVWNVLLENCVRQFEKHAGEKRIVLDCDIAETTAVTVHGVGEWLTSIMANLVSNAVKFGPPGSKVTVNTVRLGDFIETCVQDGGPGLGEQDKARLFQKFSRLSAKPTGNEHSTGLGLYTVKKMCDRLGIDIRVESEPGQGARFILRHPL